MLEPNSAAETMLDEIAKIVGGIHPTEPAATSDTSAQPTISAALAAITPSGNHVARARARGIEPAAHLAVIGQHIADTVEALKQFVSHTPPSDPNVAKVMNLISRLA